MVSPVLAERYDRLRRGWSDIYEHLPTFVSTVEELGATTVIELGVRWAVSTVAWLYALEGRGTLWSVDGAPPCADPDGNMLLDGLPLDHWRFLLGWDDDPGILAQLPEQADIVFIDTQHTYEVTTTELELYFPRVRSGGRILLHDTAIETTGNAVTPQPLYPVRTAIADFAGRLGLGWTDDSKCNGLGTIYVP